MNMDELRPRRSQSVEQSIIYGDNTQVGGDYISQTIGSMLGNGIYQWQDWVVDSSKQPFGYAQQATRDCVGRGAIERATEKRVAAETLRWNSAATPGPRLMGITGKHGSGLTWTLFRAAHEVAGLRDNVRMLVVEDPELHPETDFNAAIGGNSPAILLIDDADLQHAIRPVRRLIRSGASVLVIFTCTDVFYAQSMLALNARRTASFALATNPAESDIQDLRQVFRRQTLSLSEKHDLARGNIRSIARVLGQKILIDELVSRLVTLRQLDEASSNARTVDLASILLFTTARDILIPQSLLLKCTNTTELPKRLLPWIQIRPLRIRGGRDQLMWIEDRAAAEAEEQAWRSLSELDTTSYDDYVVQIVVRLLMAANPGRRLDATFARQLFISLRRPLRSAVAEVAGERLLQIAELEELPEFTYSWLPALDNAGLDINALIDRRAIILAETPRDPIELLLIVYYLGEAEAARRLSSRLGVSLKWGTRDWTGFIAMFEHLSLDCRSQLVRTALPLLRGGHMNIPELLRSSNTVQLLAPAVERFGSPEDRRWLWRHLHDVIGSRIHAARSFVSLAQRCIGQPRSELALSLLRGILGQDSRWSLDVACYRYDECGRLEKEEEIADRTVDVLIQCVSDTIDRPNLANNIWSALLQFAIKFVPDRAPGLVTDALGYCLDARTDGTRFKHLSGVITAGLYGTARFGNLRAEQALMVLEPFRWRTNDPEIACHFVRTLAAVARCESPASQTARDGLVALAESRGADLRVTLVAFLEATSSWAGSAQRYHLPDPLFALDRGRFKLDVLRYLVPALRLAPASNPASRAAKLMVRWGNLGPLSNHLIYELLRLGAVGPCEKIMEQWSSPTPTQLCMRSAVSARAGRLGDARNDLRESLTLYRESSHGAHPYAVHRAISELAAKSEGAERQSLLLTAALMRLGPLAEAVDVGQYSVLDDGGVEELLE